MNALFVGQKVRVVYAPAYPQLVGAETMIIGRAPEGSGYEWVIGLTDGGKPLGANSHCLEPIRPSGSGPSEFETLADLLVSVLKGAGLKAGA